jgi:DNA-binding LacI/PurR family transcriptional regulator
VFPTISAPEWSKFWTALIAMAKRMPRRRGRTGSPSDLLVYTGVHPAFEAGGYASLVSEMKAGRLGGLIFASFPVDLVGTPVMTMEGIPRVALASGVNSMFPKLPVRFADIDGFVTRAMDYLASSQGGGCKRVAMLAGTPHEDYYRNFRDAAKARGMQTQPWWFQGPKWDGVAIRMATLGLLQGPADQRPDALIINDDHLVTNATEGIAEWAGGASTRLRVVAHANFPNKPLTHWPVEFLGFDLRQLLEMCLDCIERERAGETFEPMARVPARFESEIEDLSEVVPGATAVE